MNIIALALLFPSAIIGFVATNWRWKIAALALQYLMIFILVAQSWPLGLAAVKWIAGWIACAILANTESSLPRSYSRDQSSSSGLPFKILASILVAIVAVAMAPQLNMWANSITIFQSMGGLLLIGIGLISAGLSSRALNSIVAFLTIFAGFELIYSAVEISTLLAGLLALINLGIAMTGSYLILLPTLEQSK